MIFYFSGTGNSEWVAQSVAKGTNDRNLQFIPKVSKFNYKLQNGEPLGFIFPCYAWGVPVFIEKFVRRLQLHNVDYVYFVCTCGDDTGRTGKMFCRLLEEKGWKCSLGYAVQMPESYVNLPGFDVDPKEKEKKKINDAIPRLTQIVKEINARATGVFDTLPGRFTLLKSYVVRPLFNRFYSSPKEFKSTDKCIACGKCQEVCPFHNIIVEETVVSEDLIGVTLPVWYSRCVGCMRCYHSCPKHAIEWGRFTRNKGQYLFSLSKLSSE